MAREIEEEIKETRQHIEETGSAMVEKLELLEQRLREGVEGVRRQFDLHYQAEQHPLALFGGSVAVGYLLGSLVGGRSSNGKSHHEPSRRASDLRGNGVRDHLKNEIATTVKGMAAGALTTTLLNVGRRALFGSRPSEDIETGEQAVKLGKGFALRGRKKKEGT